LKLEVVRRRRIVDNKPETFWEVKMDGKTISVTTYDPTSLVEAACKEYKEKLGGDYSQEKI
jgi:hypothetical protein